MDKHKQGLTTFVDPNCMIYIGKYVENYKADSSGAKGGMHPPICKNRRFINESARMIVALIVPVCSKVQVYHDFS